MTTCLQVLGLRFVLMVWFSTVRALEMSDTEHFPNGGCAKNAQSYREHPQLEFNFSSLLQTGPKRQSEMDGERNFFHCWQQLWRGISDSGTVFEAARCSGMSLKTRTWFEKTFHMPVLTAWEGDLNFLVSHLTPMHPEQTWGSWFHGLVEVLYVHLSMSLA